MTSARSEVIRESGKSHFGSGNLGTRPRKIGVEGRVVPGGAPSSSWRPSSCSSRPIRPWPHDPEEGGAHPVLARLGAVAKAAFLLEQCSAIGSVAGGSCLTCQGKGKRQDCRNKGGVSHVLSPSVEI